MRQLGLLVPVVVGVINVACDCTVTEARQTDERWWSVELEGEITDVSGRLHPVWRYEPLPFTKGNVVVTTAQGAVFLERDGEGWFTADEVTIPGLMEVEVADLDVVFYRNEHGQVLKSVGREGFWDVSPDIVVDQLLANPSAPAHVRAITADGRLLQFGPVGWETIVPADEGDFDLVCTGGGLAAKGDSLYRATEEGWILVEVFQHPIHALNCHGAVWVVSGGEVWIVNDNGTKELPHSALSLGGGVAVDTDGNVCRIKGQKCTALGFQLATDIPPILKLGLVSSSHSLHVAEAILTTAEYGACK